MIYEFKAGREDDTGILVMQCRQMDICVQGTDIADCLDKMANQFRFHALEDALPSACPDSAWEAYSKSLRSTNSTKEGSQDG